MSATNVPIPLRTRHKRAFLPRFAPVALDSPAKPESVTLSDADPLVSDSPETGSSTQHRGSNTIDEIRDDLRLDRLQAFDDEQERKSESDREGFSHNVSDEYLDFLLSFE
ncbi:MAG: hypothetical protein ACRDEA_22990 [Microcystaceae cyanobacterium]